MNEDQMKQHALELAGIYYMLLDDTKHVKHDPDAHNVCSAVVQPMGGGPTETYYSYSNISALKAQKYQKYTWVTGEEGAKIINRGGFQDYHTEVRLINGLYAKGKMVDGTVIFFFSSRTVCNTCRPAIYTAMRFLQGRVGFMAFEFRVEQHGTLTDNIYPIHQTSGQQHGGINYEL